MAIGNIGNLLQHFVALKVAQKVVVGWNRPNDPIEYIDCYAMAPWETITGGQPQGFVNVVRSFHTANEDFVAQAFSEAWRFRYGEHAVPEDPNDREYPNTAFLLANSFPNQHWAMRLHENDSAEKGKQNRLRDWVASQTKVSCTVEGDWQQSAQICNCPAAREFPVIVMLDPYRIVPDGSEVSIRPGYLRGGRLRFLCGQHGLRICGEGSDRSTPAVVCLFSYSDVAPGVPDRIVRGQFEKGWRIEQVRSGPWNLRGKDSYHQGWIVSQNLEKPVIAPDPQAEWERWCSYAVRRSSAQKGANDA